VGLTVEVITSVLLRGVASKELSSNILFKGRKGFFLTRESIGPRSVSSIILEELLYFRILLLRVLVSLSN
jgi:hypothetical protein